MCAFLLKHSQQYRSEPVVSHGHSGCRANFRVLSLLVGISALAACNALYVPLRLEQVIHTHPRSSALLQAAEADGWLQDVSNITASGVVGAYMTIFCRSLCCTVACVI